LQNEILLHCEKGKFQWKKEETPGFLRIIRKDIKLALAWMRKEGESKDPEGTFSCHVLVG
jgi:hypothetical protein